MAAAGPVFILDQSFDDQPLSRGSWTNDLGSWQETGGPGNGSGFIERIQSRFGPPFSSTGENHLGMTSGHDVWQDLDTIYQANYRYTLTIAAGNREGMTGNGNQTQYILADPQGTIFGTRSFDASAVTAGNFQDAPSLVFETPDDPRAVGKPIRILLRARGNGRSHFDNIRLSAEELPPDGRAHLGNPAATNISAEAATLQVEVLERGEEDPDLTFFWGTTNGEEDEHAWAHSQTLPSPQSGVAKLNLTNLLPGTRYFFSARAANSGGTSWLRPSATFTTHPGPPSVTNVEPLEIGATTAVLAANITVNGGENPSLRIYYGRTDGGTEPQAWDHLVNLGVGNGMLSQAVVNLESSQVYFFRAHASNAGGDSWAPETSSFRTLTVLPPAVKNLAPESVTSKSAILRGEVTSTGNEIPEVTIYYGTSDGESIASAWDHSLFLGSHQSLFDAFLSDLSSETTYYYRAMVSNRAGTAWAETTQTFQTTAVAPKHVVINEIHFKPEDESTLGEFVELHNPTTEPVDLGGWRLSSGIDFTFPPGTSIPAHAYLVVAQDPAYMFSQYGVVALGPYTGGLSSAGERINLRDDQDAIVDQVDYGVGFPWPSRSDGGGSSVERINASLPSQLPGSWRASGTAMGGVSETYLQAGSAGWRYFIANTEPEGGPEAWRDPTYEDSSWPAGAAPLGYGVPNLATVFPTAQETDYTSVYLRREFILQPDHIPAALKVRLFLDDGCIIWINGIEVDRHLAPTGEPDHSTTAADWVTNPVWYEFTIGNLDEVLLGGTNVIAVQLLNIHNRSGDLAFDVELADDFATGNNSPGTPTPGEKNSVYLPASQAPPSIDLVTHLPQVPKAGEPVTISARIIDPDGVTSASVFYQIVHPGSYVRGTDSEYENSWVELPMSSDGAGHWSVVMPSELQMNRRLVRYRISFEDTHGNREMAPYPDDQSRNFAYFVSDGIPDWQGALRPGESPLKTIPSATLTSVPVFTLIAHDSDVINSQFNAGANHVRFYGTFVANGRVYDHIQFQNRGQGSTYNTGKNKWRFRFNRGNRFRARDADGNEFAQPWKDITANACASPWAALNRGAAGLDEMAPFRAYQLAGVPAPNTLHYHFRVVRGVEESPAPGSSRPDSLGQADGQYLGDFWGLYTAIEPLKGSFLKEHGLPDGNIYRIDGNNGDKKEQAAGQPADSSDWNAFRNAHVNADPSTQWWRDNMDMQAYYSFHAINRLTGNVDLRSGANHYFYHRSSDDRWVPIPWDLDMMFIAKSHWSSPWGSAAPGAIDAHKSLLQNPQLMREFRNRAREILDLLASDASPDGGQMGQILAELSERVHQPGSETSLAWADAYQWNLHPRTNGADSVASGQTNHRGNFYRTPFLDNRFGGTWTRWLRAPSYSGTAAPEDTFSEFLHYVTDTWPGGSNWTVNNGNQSGYGYQYLLAESADSLAPTRPSLTYSGIPGFPSDGLQVRATPFEDPQGPQTFAARQWRLAQVGKPGLYEINALWTMITTDPTEVEMTLPTAGIQPGARYRVRVRQADHTERWSHWSEPLEFTASTPSSVLVHYWNFDDKNEPLRVTQTSGGASAQGTGSLTSDKDKGFVGANARVGYGAGRHLRVNNPLSSQASLRFDLPTTGFHGIIVKYETRRSAQGAGQEIIEYTVDGSTYLPMATHAVADADPQVMELDFRTLAQVDDNPDFGIRFTFAQGDGGPAGNNRFDNLTVEGQSLHGGPRLIPSTDAGWNFAENWHHHSIPNEAGDAAIIGAPVAHDREVVISSPVTIGHLSMENSFSPLRNRLSGEAALLFDNQGVPAKLEITGTGSGFSELRVMGGSVLNSDLIVDVDSQPGESEYGGLRLRETWTGVGGMIKTGPGMLALTGPNKNWEGATVIQEGILSLTAPASPSNSASLIVSDGAQLRLTSSGTAELPALYSPGGTLSLSGMGPGLGGSLRYDPGLSPGSLAVIGNPLALESDASVHISGTDNSLHLQNTLTGAHTLVKSGDGTLVLSGITDSAGARILVSGGILKVTGQHHAEIELQAAALLKGDGTVGPVSGMGGVDVESNKLTAHSLTHASLAALLENVNTSAGNGCLVAGFVSNPARVDLYLHPDRPLADGDHMSGGLESAQEPDLSSATVRIFVADESGPVRYSGHQFREAQESDNLHWGIMTTPTGKILQVVKYAAPTGYALWRRQHFDPQSQADDEISGPQASPAGDGVANLLRYAFGVGPYEPVFHLLPRMVRAKDQLEFWFRPDAARGDLAWEVQSSSDLDDWSQIIFDSQSDPLPVLNPEGWRAIPVALEAPQAFYRLRVRLK